MGGVLNPYVDSLLNPYCGWFTESCQWFTVSLLLVVYWILSVAYCTLIVGGLLNPVSVYWILIVGGLLNPVCGLLYPYCGWFTESCHWFTVSLLLVVYWILLTGGLLNRLLGLCVGWLVRSLKRLKYSNPWKIVLCFYKCLPSYLILINRSVRDGDLGSDKFLYSINFNKDNNLNCP